MGAVKRNDKRAGAAKGTSVGAVKRNDKRAGAAKVTAQPDIASIWTPQPRQAAFQSRMEYEALYGGAAGGGKSDALLTEALRQAHIPHYRALLLRKTYPQLSELIDRSQTLYGAAFPTARYNATSHVWRFPSGAQIHFGAMQHPADRVNYQGKQYDFVGFDELTHFTFEEYSYLFSRNRPSGPGTRVYIRATTNPGGVGHAWVKERFIDAAPPMTPITEEVEVRTPDGRLMRLKRDRVFVPSRVFDNDALLRNNPSYLANLALLPEAEKQALLYGSWDSFSGQAFPEWRNCPDAPDGLGTHVIPPFRAPRHWLCYRGFDFGYSRPYAVGWFLADEEGRLFLARELYGTSGAPNVGVKEHPAEIARRIREIEQGDDTLRGRRIIGVADPSIFDESRGESVARMMEKAPNLIVFRRGANARLAGKMQFHYRLAARAEERPMLQVFSTCRHFIRTLPALTYSAQEVEDIDTSQEDHLYDMARYVMMENPISPPRPTPPTPRGDDPLELRGG